jgi:hypothetical protein
MIFMAISGFMFIVAANFISGKQAKSQFRQGLNSLNSDTRQVINDVSNGFFPATDLKCSANSSGPPQIIPGTANQGENKGCVFMGKVIQFSGGDTKNFYIYTVAGRHYVGDSTTIAGRELPTSFAEAQPVAIDGSPKDLTDIKTLQWGLKATGLYMLKAGVTPCPGGCPSASSYDPISAVGFYSSFGNYVTSGDDSVLASGGQNVIIVPITGSPPHFNETQTVISGYIKDTGTYTALPANPEILVCLDGGSGQYGKLTIGGGSGQRLTTTIKATNPPAAGEICS